MICLSSTNLKFRLTDGIDLSCFKDQLIFYLRHPDDVGKFLISYFIVDFQKREISYIIGHSKESLDRFSDKEFISANSLKNAKLDPHCSFLDKNGSIITFVDRANYVYVTNEEGIKFYTESDLSTLCGMPILSLSCTNYKEGDYFFTSAVTGAKSLSFFKIATDLSSSELISTIDFREQSCAPHVIRKIDNSLLTSNFSGREILFNGKIISPKAFMIEVYDILYRDYCDNIGILYDKKTFLEENKIGIRNVRLEENFKKFCEEKGSNFLEICNTYNINVNFKPGQISAFDMTTNSIIFYDTTCMAPAHFELDEDNFVYASSHNLVDFDKRYFWGTAALDKFEFKDGKLEKLGTFQDISGYRFTSHRVFKCNGKKYICTFGQPNRLFFIDADTMELVYFDDIDKKLLPDDTSKIFHFVNFEFNTSAGTTALEVSGEGGLIFFIEGNYIWVYSFLEKKVVYKHQYLFDFSVNELNLKDFFKHGAHTNYLK